MFSAPALADEWASLPMGFPKSVRDFMLRRLTCQHWEEEGFNPSNYSPAKIRKLKREVAALNCGSLGQDEAALRKRYARDVRVQRALTDSVNWDPPQ